MNTEAAERFAELVKSAREDAIAYDPETPELTVVNDCHIGHDAIQKFINDPQWHMTDAQIDAASWNEWENEIWWYALQVAAKQIVEKH